MRAPRPTQLARTFAFAFALALSACSGGERASANVPPLDVEQLAGDWLYATPAGDTLFATITVNDTTLAGVGYLVNPGISSSTGNLVTRIPIVMTGWASPTRHRAHGDVRLQPGTTLAAVYGSVFDGTIDARILDLQHLMATIVVRMNDEVIWQRQEEVPLDRQP